MASIAELFQVCPVGGNKVEIFAVGPPLSLTPTFRWQLIVNEQGGAPDLYPVFRAIIPGSLVCLLSTECVCCYCVCIF